MKKKRIGIFGGTFDPPHVGHLIIAEQARAQVGLDRIYFIPAFLPPHKRKNSSAQPLDRLTMSKLAVRGDKALRVSDIEIRRKGISYTIDTVRGFHRRYPKAELFLIVGEDNYAAFKTWKSYKEILRSARLIVYRRSSQGMIRTSRSSKKRMRLLQGTLLDISSSDVRRHIQERRSIRSIVPAAVERYIRSKKLYRS
ncbi:MAG TPA: nicotinate-nucleotide adenylyltransferase [Bacteroidota bacterium]